MADPIHEYFENAQLSMAAYAALTQGITGVAYKTALKSAGFSDTQATDFISAYSVVRVFDDPATDFSATLFQKNGSADKILAIRGTESWHDIVITDLQIGVFGLANQYASLQNFYEQILAQLQPADTLTVTGHSLGGFLAQAFTLDHQSLVSHAYTYNSPGLGGILINPVGQLGITANPVPNSLITNLIAQGHSFVSSTGAQFGTPQDIFIETSLNPLTNHGKGAIMDSLALYDLFARVDPGLSRNLSAITEILEAESSDSDNSLEKGLNALRKLFGDSAITETPTSPPGGDPSSAARNMYYTNLIALRDSLPAGSFEVRSLIGQPASIVTTQALTEIAYRHALKELNPFVVLGVNYTPYNETGELSLVDPETGAGELTLQYLIDRANFLAKKIEVNSSTITLPSSTHFKDSALHEEIGSATLGIPQVLFGDGSNDSLVGSQFFGDHLYGGEGEDHLFGYGGKDYLEGNRDNDILDGGSGADTMLGGSGNDIYIVDNSGDVVREYANSGDDVVRSSVTFTLDSQVEHLTLTGTDAINGIGNELRNTIIGNSAKNVLNGGGGQDHLVGNGGNDVLLGGSGDNDLLEGGIGFDTYIYHSGDGLDRIEDSDAQGQIIFDDHLLQGGIRRVGAAANTYTSLDGRTTYMMSNTDLIVNGVLIVNENFQSGQMGIQLRDVSGLPHDMGVPVGPFPDTYIGDNNDNDYVGRSAPGALAIYGNGGNDTLYGDHAPPVGGFQDLLDGGPGHDVFFGGYGDDYLIGGSGDDYAFMTEGDMFLGGDGDDYAVGVADFWDSTGPRIGSGAHYADGGAGNDTFLGEVGGDVLLGGDGDDVLRGENRPNGWLSLVYDNFMWNRTAQAAVVSPAGGDDYLDGGAGNDLLVGDGGNDILIGGAGDDLLYGESDFAQTIPGDDWLDGGEGNDRLFGGAGADSLSGGDGDDLLIGDFSEDLGSEDILDGGAGADELQGGGGDDILYGGIGIDRLAGFGGNDFLDGGADDDELQGGLGDDALWGGIGNDRITGQEGDDTLFGDEGDDELQGDVGSDTIFGGQGHDALFGQDGNDLLSGDAGDDLLNGGLGNDQLDGGDGIDDVQGREGDDLIAGGTGDDFLYGDGNDPTVLNLLRGNDTLDGEEGDDQLWGGAGQDQLFGGEGTDQLVGDLGDDELYGEAGDDLLFGDSPFFVGQAGADVLDGGEGNDVLQGGGGDDDLHGGLGNDRLIGGGGLDTYRFNLGHGVDSIEDDATQSNRVVFGAGITAASLSLDVATGDSLVVRVGNGGDAVQIVGFGLDSPAEFHTIGRFEFADGTVLTDAQLLSRGFNLSAPMDGGTVLGTAYADHIEGSQVDDWFHGRDGNDVLIGGEGADVLEGEDGDDVLNGGSGNDRLYGSAGSNVLRGGEGNDLLDSAGVGDQLFGGMGDDNYHLWSASQIIGEDVNAGIDTVHLAPTASLTFQTPNNVENVTIQDDFPLDPTMQVNMVGNVLDNVLSGSHWLDGQAGNDTLIGLGDNTFVFGRGYGHDTVQTGMQWYAHTGLDQVQFLAGVAPTDLVIENHANDLVVKINGTIDQLTVQSYFVSPSTTVDQFVFAGGTVWGLTEIESRVRTFVGSEGDDTFYGTLGDDIIRGVGGNDQIRASLGNDVLDGGAGSDFLEGWSGNDTYVFGRGYGQDYIDEQGDSSDSDTLQLVDGITPGDITLRATPDFGGDAILTINNTTDELTLAGFFLFDSLRVDRIQFADGTTWDYTAMVAHTQGVELEGTDSSNSLYGNVTNDILSGLGGDDSLYGGAGNDTLLGGAGVDRLDGGTGSDTLDGGIGPDAMVGGSGNDLYLVDDVGDGVTEQAGQGTDTVQSSVTYALGVNVENLTLSGSAVINGTGNSLNNTLTGNGAANVLTGGAGSDTYVVGVGDTVVEAASAGTDTIKTDIGWTLGANVENLVLTGTAAVDGTGNGLANTLTGNSAANTLNGGTGADTLIGGQGNDTYVVDNVSDKITESAIEGLDTVQSSVTYTLAANVENLTLTGTGAINGTGNGLDNILTGNNAANRLTGGAGNDTYVIGAGDSIVESVNAGIDSVQSSVTHTLAANVENLTLAGTATINGTGNGLNNILIGNSAVNTLTGGAGNDTYIVGAGDTVVEALNAGTDTVQSSVTWSLGANVENLVLVGSVAVNGTGNTLANVLTGNAGNNALVGGDGNDTMVGGQGNDVLNGGTGNDVFQFARGDGQDTVTDTSGSSDRLNFGSGINPLDIMLSQSANDLRIALYGSTDQVTIANWYGGATNQIETVQAGNGQQLMSTQVNQLIQAMAGFTQQTGLSWEQAVAQRPQDVQQVLAANWH